jgi:hypothetical protein
MGHVAFSVQKRLSGMPVTRTDDYGRPNLADM